MKKELRGIHFKYIFSPHQSFRSALFLKSLRAEIKIGYQSWWNFLFFDQRVSRDWELPEALRLMSLLAAVSESSGISAKLADYKKQNPQGNMNPVPDWADMSVHDLWTRTESYQKFLKSAHGSALMASGDYAVIFPGSVWATKRWTEQGFRSLTEKWSKNRTIIFLGSKDERPLVEKIIQNINHERVINRAGDFSLEESLHVVAGAKLVVSNDSGGQHMATLLGRAVVSIFGPTNTNFGFRPWGTRAVIVEAEGLGCRPCGVHGHKKCPLEHHNCMKNISAEQVDAAATKLLS